MWVLLLVVAGGVGVPVPSALAIAAVVRAVPPLPEPEMTYEEHFAGSQAKGE